MPACGRQAPAFKPQQLTSETSMGDNQSQSINCSKDSKAARRPRVGIPRGAGFSRRGAPGAHNRHSPPVGWCDSIDSCSAVGGFTLALSRRELDRVGLTRVIAVVDVRSHKGINI